MGADPRARAAALVEALGGTGGAAPRRGVLHVVAVPRFDPGLSSLRAAVVVAGADEVRRPPTLPPDVLAPLVTGRLLDGSLEQLEVAGLVLEDRVVVQLVPTGAQTAPATVLHVERLRDAGVPVEVVASTGEVEAALVAGGIGPGVPRSPTDQRLDHTVFAADRPDLPGWRDLLRRRGWFDTTPVRLVERAGTPMQREHLVQVRDFQDTTWPGPIVAVVGDDPAGPVPWRDVLPLRGAVVANLRTPHQAPALTARLRSLGAHVVEAPLLDTADGDVAELDAAVRAAAEGAYGLVALTSPNGVAALADAVARTGLDARALAAVGTVACVGPGTAAALHDALRVRADVVAEVSTTEGLADELGAPATAGTRALLPRADLATDLLRDRLQAAGWAPHEVVAYRTVTRDWPVELADVFGSGQVEVVPVLSSSMARAVVRAGRQRGIPALFVSIGPVTSATLREHGVEPFVEADPHDLDGLVDAVVEAVERRRAG